MDSSKEGGTNGTNGFKGIREPLVARGINEVTFREATGVAGGTSETGDRGTLGAVLRELTAAAGGPPGAGDKVNGYKHGGNRIVSMERDTTWAGMCTTPAIIRG